MRLLSSFLTFADESGVLMLKSFYNYYAQVHGEMTILGVTWCDFAVFSKGTVAVDTVNQYWQGKLLPEFYTSAFIKEILSGTILKQRYHQ